MTIGKLPPADLYLERCADGPFRDVQIPADAAAAAAELGLTGAPFIARQIEVGLRVALTHDSYLHEHPQDARYLTPGVLKALESLGSSWLSRELAIFFYSRQRYSRSGPLSSAIAFGRRTFDDWAATLGWLADAASFGRSLDVSNLPQGATTRIALQILGLVTLLGEHNHARQIARPFFAQVTEATATQIVDPRTRLQREMARLRRTYEWTHTNDGPDHQTNFTARITDGNGRVVVGTGISKKKALAAAADAYLRQYLPHRLTPESTEPAVLPNAVVRSGDISHAKAVTTLAEHFGLGRGHLPLLSQAFIHPSWAYENALEMRRCNQQDNQVLALVGSHVLAHEHALTASREALTALPLTFALRDMLNETYPIALRQTGLSSGVLLSVGQQHSLEEGIAASAFQAAMAAVFLGLRRPRSLLESWPPDWTDIRHLIAPAQTRRHDPTTQLQQVASAAENYAFSTRGADHVRQYTALLTLDSGPLRRRLGTTGDPARSRSLAKHSVSQRVQGSFRQLAQVNPMAGADLMARRGEDRSLPYFLLAHLVAVAEISPGKAREWRKHQLLGTHLTSHPTDLVAWAQAADRMLSRQRLVVPDADRLELFFRVAAAGDDGARDHMQAELQATMNWVSPLEDPALINETNVARLVHLAAAYRALSPGQPGGALAESVNDWSILYRDTITVVGEVPEVWFSPIELAALEAVIKVATSAGRPVQVQVVSGATLHVRPIVATPELMQLAVQFWGKLSHRLRLQQGPDGVMLTLPQPVRSGRGPLEDAVERALQPAGDPVNAAVADLLHDLKNQITASWQAATVIGGGRAAEAQRRADSLKHLDKAAAMTRRIGAATSLLGTPGDQSTALSTFLHHYWVETMSSLPAHLSLTQPRDRAEVEVGLDEPSLRAVVENLVKNAFEAMPTGGTVSLDWISDDRTAVLEVADDGPGLPDHVAAAFAGGHSIKSAKSGGNGLGLLGVRDLLRRIGGILELTPTVTGTRWNLTIPLAHPAVTEVGSDRAELDADVDLGQTEETE